MTTSGCFRDSPSTRDGAVLEKVIADTDRVLRRSMPGVTKAIDERRRDRIVLGIGVAVDDAGVSALDRFALDGKGVEPATPRTENLRLICERQSHSPLKGYTHEFHLLLL